VFELYRQADETGSNRPGLGIGLSIVAQIVKLHGGIVRVESPGLGQGSSFVVTLPLLPAPATGPGSGSSGRHSGKSRRAKPAHATTTKTERQS
jgi:hypothetical protein